MGWQTYSDEADALMEKEFKLLEQALRDYEIMPFAVADKCEQLFERCEEQLPGMGYTDTESRWELVDRVNKVLKEIGYAKIVEL